VSLLRRLRIAAPAQLPLVLDEGLSDAADRWWSLPEQSRQEVLALLARFIARGIVCDGEETM
jgi:hypothetical protein